MRRREFLFGSAAFGCLAGCLHPDGAARTVVGILTDTHVTPDPSSADPVCRAYRIFRRQGAAAVLHVGDLAHRWSAAAYANHVDARARAYDGAVLPKEWHSFGYHDLIDFEVPGQPRDFEVRRARAVRAWKDVRSRIGVAHDLYARFSCGGYGFLVFPQYPERTRMERMLDEASRENPGLPVFVIEHIPPFDAGPLTRRYDDFEPWTREVFARYPQVVVLYGHIHSGLRDERCVWQGDFTAVNCGGLTSFQCDYVGQPLAPETNDSVLTLELENDRFSFSRWDLRSGEQIGEPWTFVRATGVSTGVPYRRQPPPPSVLPSYPADAKVRCSTDPFGDVPVVFPEVAVAANRTYRHRIELFHPGSDVAYARVDEPGPWCKRPDERRTMRTVVLPSGLFDVGADTIVRVTPEDFDERFGSSLETHYVQASTRWREVWRGAVAGHPQADYPEGVNYAIPSCTAAVGRKARVVFDFSADEDAMLSLVDGRSHRLLAPVVWGRGDGVFRRYCLATTEPLSDEGMIVWPNFSIARQLLVKNVRVYIQSTKG